MSNGNVTRPGCATYLHFVASQSAPHRGHGRHGHANANASVSVLRRSHESECACAVAHRGGPSHGVRVLQLEHRLVTRNSLCRRCLRFRVSAVASSLPSRGIYVVANERRERRVNAAESRGSNKGTRRDDSGY